MKTYNEIKDELEQRYLDNDGNSCPFCGSDDISAGHFDFDGREAWRSVECEKCGKEWTEVLSLVGAEFHREDIAEIMELNKEQEYKDMKRCAD